MLAKVLTPGLRTAMQSVSTTMVALIKPPMARIDGPQALSVKEAEQRLRDATAALAKLRDEEARLAATQAAALNDDDALDQHERAEARVKRRIGAAERIVGEATDAIDRAREAEAETARWARYKAAVRDIDALGKKGGQRIPELFAELAAWQERFRASDAQADAANQDLPAGAASLIGAEFYARGAPAIEASVTEEVKTLWTRDGHRMPLERQDQVRVNADGRTGTIQHPHSRNIPSEPDTATLRKFRITKTSEARMMSHPRESICDIVLPPAREPALAQNVTTRVEMIDEAIAAEPRQVPYARDTFEDVAA